MKYLVVSDIHGYEEYIEYLYHIVESEKPDKIIILGDIMSYSSNNNKMNGFINEYSDKIILTPGNMDNLDKITDSISDRIFDVYTENVNGKDIIFTHGHLNIDFPNKCDVLVSGHTHRNSIFVSNKDGIRVIRSKPYIYFNPGSLSLPRCNSANSYGLITDNELIIKDIKGYEIKKLTYNKM